MARKPRLHLPGCALHLVQRGNDRQRCFVDDEDRLTYLRYLRACATGAGVDVHAYVLMGNHVHLLLTPRDKGGASALMQGLGAVYVRYFNARHARSGTLWEGRFRSCIVDSGDYLWNCHRYIELNPVRAALAERPSQYPWSSHRANARGAFDPVVTQHPAYLALGTCPASRSAAYAGFFSSAMSAAEVDEIRRVSKLDGVFGGDDFQRVVVAASGVTPSSGKPGRRPAVSASRFNLL